MNFRKRAQPQLLGFQIAPMVDILLVLLVFFIVTWNFALTENELDVKVPTASAAKEQQPVANQTVLNVRKNGTVVMNRKELTLDELRRKLAALSELYPDYAIIVRGDKQLPFEDLMAVMDICRQANIWNVAFATAVSPQ
ncbi:MAG: biopolymer transporter ExbD [Chthoniobacteraceae bacterium]|nr:biopolymer transporter ExbD [Chthoniobacteraceae bacterium]